MTNDAPLNGDDPKLYEVDGQAMRKVGETWARCPRREVHMTHHIFRDAGGSTYKIPWRDVNGAARGGKAKKIHLVSKEAKDIVERVRQGEIDWTEALVRLNDMEPLRGRAER